MLTLQDSVSIAANSSNPNILATSRLEFAPSQGEVNVYLTGSAIGLTARVLIAGDEVQETSGVNTQNRFPVVPDDVIVAGIPVDQGEKIVIEASNTTIGALTLFFKVELVPVEVFA